MKWAVSFPEESILLVRPCLVATCQELGFVLYARHQRRVFPLSLWQRRRKEQGLPVVEEEDVLVFRKESEVAI